jgi:carbonic anhydrase
MRFEDLPLRHLRSGHPAPWLLPVDRPEQLSYLGHATDPIRFSMFGGQKIRIVWPEEAGMSVIDEFIENNKVFAEGFDKGDLPLPPAKKVAIVACMDARLNPYPILGLSIGDAHVIRNAGGVITDGEIRSLAISQHLLGTKEIMLIHHTDCGMLTFSDTEFEQMLEEEAGRRPEWRPRSFPDLEGDVRDSIQRIKESPFIPEKDEVRGFVYDVKTGRLHEVS